MQNLHLGSKYLDEMSSGELFLREKCRDGREVLGRNVRHSLNLTQVFEKWAPLTKKLDNNCILHET